MRSALVSTADWLAMGNLSPRAIFAHYDRIQVKGQAVLCVRAVNPDRERFVGMTGVVTMTRDDGEVMVVFDGQIGAQSVHMRCAELEPI